jgi:hypothetical protein
MEIPTFKILSFLSLFLIASPGWASNNETEPQEMPPQTNRPSMTEETTQTNESQRPRKNTIVSDIFCDCLFISSLMEAWCS